MGGGDLKFFVNFLMILTHQLDPEPCTAGAKGQPKNGKRGKKAQACCELPWCLIIGQAKLEFTHLSRLLLPP